MILSHSKFLGRQHTGPAQVRYPQTQRIEVATKEMRWPRKWPNGPNGPGPKWSIGPMAQLGPESAQWPNGPMASNMGIVDLVQSYY